MDAKHYQAGEDARNAHVLNDALLEVARQDAGVIETDRPASYTAVQHEATEWKCARLEPQISRLLEGMPGAVLAHDSGVIIGFNERVPELLGCPAETILWRRLGKFIDPISLPTLTRWIETSECYSILVNGLRPGGDSLLLRLEA